jgi:putative flavoprotein involved in K+ transport
VRLPDFPFPHADPDGFAASRDILDYVNAYAAFVAPPIRCGVALTALRRSDGGFVAETSGGPIEADNVVVATGPYQRPILPAALSDEIGGFQVHACNYTNPDRLPPGAVLVVGSGASGAQITDELVRAGRRVYLSFGRHTRLPRRYRSRDLIWWLREMGIDQTPVEQRGPSRLLPVISGAHGGHTIDFRRFAADGVSLLGRITAARDGVLEVAPDLAENLAGGDAAYAGFVERADAHVEHNALPMPPDPAALARLPDPASVTEPCRRLDIRAEGIAAVIWATGYGLDFGWIDIPILNPRGEPVHRRGIAEVPGLYFLGLQWLSKMSSSFLSGVGDDAAVLADHIAARGRQSK